MDDVKLMPIRIEKVANGFVTSVLNRKPNPPKEIVHVFHTPEHLATHILKHFGYDGKISFIKIADPE